MYLFLNIILYAEFKVNQYIGKTKNKKLPAALMHSSLVMSKTNKLKTCLHRQLSLLVPIKHENAYKSCHVSASLCVIIIPYDVQLGHSASVVSPTVSSIAEGTQNELYTGHKQFAQRSMSLNILCSVCLLKTSSC